MSNQRVLIVDDQVEVRRMLQAGIDTLGLRLDVISVPSGEEALLVASRKKIHVLIADIRLPGMTGLELMSKIRKRNPEIRVILVTGFTDADLLRQYAASGASAVFSKPVSLDEFLITVVRMLKLAKTGALTPSTVSKTGALAPSILSKTALKNIEPAQRLARLVKDIQAIAAMLFDDQGKIIARAGALTSQEEAALFPPAITLGAAALQLGNCLESRLPASFHFITGSRYNIILSPVSGAAILLIVMADNRLWDGLDLLVNTAVIDLRQAIQAEVPAPETPGNQKPAEAVPAREEAAPRQTIFDAGSPGQWPSGETLPEGLLSGEIPELSDLFEPSRSEFVPQDVDQFWDQAVNQQEPGKTNDASITYEEARRLGLAPEQEA
ncbi:MAG: response regulator [Omnitrophica WOR_2 bacterium]